MRPTLLAAAVAALFGLPACVAQAAPALAEPSLDTVTVTAKGYAADSLETPSAVTVLNYNDIAARGASVPGDALAGQPGIAIHGDGAWGKNPVLRGLKKESVALLVDGQRLQGGQPYGALASLVQAGLLDRIEVVKGPGSVLYGSGALGGVVNLITPEASFSTAPRAGASLVLDGASAGLGWGAAGGFQASNADHALSLTAGARHQGDYDSPDGKVARTGYDSEALYAKYRLRLAPGHVLRLNLQQQIDSDVWYPGSASRPAAPPGLGTVTIHSPRQERTLTDLGYTWQLGGERPLTIDGNVYLQDVMREIRAWSSTLGRDRVRNQVTFATRGANLKADWLLHPDHLLSAGVQAWRMTASPARYLDSNVPLYNNNVRQDPFTSGEVTSLGFYLQDQWSVTERLKLTLGVRRDTVTGRAGSFLVNPQSGLRTSNNLEHSDGTTSWSLGGTYAAAPLFNPYFSLARAFRAPDLRERFESSERGDGYFYVGNPQLEPESAINKEIGIKGRDGRFDYAVALYRNDIGNYITGRPTGTKISGLDVKQTENLGRAVIRGIEAEGRVHLGGAHYLSASYSRVRGDNKVDDEPLYQMPADEVGLGWALAPESGWGADLRLRLVARQDRVATRFTRSREDETPGFATADLGATWYGSGAWKGQTLRLGVRNLADKRYHEHLTEGLSGQEILAPGRNFFIRWKGTL